MATFEHTSPEADNEDRVYVRVDDFFDISILRAEEGLVIDVCDNDDIDLVPPLAAGFLLNREERP